MNVKELKKLATDWIDAPRCSAAEFAAAQAMHDAIMALPDDPQAEHEDLVEMARRLEKSTTDVEKEWRTAALVAAVLERFGKRESETFVKYEVRSDTPIHPSLAFQSKEAALAYVRSTTIPYRVFKITGTEEV